MFGVGVGIRVGGRTPVGGSAYDADAQAFFDRVTTAGGTLTTTEKNATNQLVLDMKSAGIWTAMRAVYPMVGASAAACAQNLKSSSFTGTFSSGWTFASTGVTPNGSSAYMDTNTTIFSNFTASTISFSYYSRTNSTAPLTYTTEIGVGNGTPNLAYYELDIKRTSGNASTNMSDGFVNFISVANADSRGYYIANRNGASLLNYWKNGSKIGTNTATSTFAYIPTNNILIAAAKDGSSPVGNFSNRECAFASLGDGLTDTQASNFYTCVQTFQTTLSRAIAP
jgi:hypothetical protein